MFHNIKLKIAGFRMKFWYGAKHNLANSFPNAKGWVSNGLDNAYEYARIKHHNSSVDYCNLLFGHK